MHDHPLASCLPWPSLLLQAAARPLAVVKMTVLRLLLLRVAQLQGLVGVAGVW